MLVEIKTNKLISPALDYAVAKCKGEDYIAESGANGIGIEYEATSYSTNWSQGGPIIERELIRVIAPTVRGVDWIARIKRGLPSSMNRWFEETGPTPLIAAMRCYVASKLGGTVQIPRELAP